MHIYLVFQLVQDNVNPFNAFKISNALFFSSLCHALMHFPGALDGSACNAPAEPTVILSYFDVRASISHLTFRDAVTCRVSALYSRDAWREKQRAGSTCRPLAASSEGLCRSCQCLSLPAGIQRIPSVPLTQVGPRWPFQAKYLPSSQMNRYTCTQDQIMHWRINAQRLWEKHWELL